MSTKELIDAALAADKAKEQTAQALATGKQQALAGIQGLQQQDDDALDVKDQAHQAVHDDLAANGNALYVDDSTTPPTYNVVVPVEPDDFAMTPIRVA